MEYLVPYPCKESSEAFEIKQNELQESLVPRANCGCWHIWNAQMINRCLCEACPMEISVVQCF